MRRRQCVTVASRRVIVCSRAHTNMILFFFNSGVTCSTYGAKMLAIVI